MSVVSRLMMSLVAAVLLYGAIAKSLEPNDFAAAASYLTGWSLASVRPFGVGMVIVEFLLGSALVLGVSVIRLRAAILASVMIADLTVPLAMLTNDPSAPVCGCFGGSAGFAGGSEMNAIGLVRNGVLLALLLGSILISWRPK